MNLERNLPRPHAKQRRDPGLPILNIQKGRPDFKAKRVNR